MIDNKIIQKVSDFCIGNLDLKTSKLGPEYYYASMPLCVIDSIFSLNTKYATVIKLVKNLCDYYQIAPYAKNSKVYPPLDEQISTSEFLDFLGNKTPQELAIEVFKNRRPTSAKSGILRTEAVVRFLKVLKEFNAEYFQDIPKLINNDKFELCITNIPGQKSGITLKYFFMLTGSDDLIKPDRWILQFLKAATGQNFNHDKCQIILSNVTNELNNQGYILTPRLLDHIIWKYRDKIP